MQRTLIEAVLLTGLVLLVFLHSWRSTVIVLLAIPTSLIATFGVMWLQGFTLNFLTTLALTLTIGILVDDSIVVLENIYRHLARGEPPRLAAINGRAEIGLAAIAITLVDVVVFTPVALMSGQVGQFFRQFGFTVVAATLFSLLVSFTLTPLLASRWLKAEDEHGRGPLAAFGRWWERGFDRLTRVYERALRWTLRGRWLVVLGAVVALAVGVALPATGIVKSEFFPAQDEGVFTLFLETPPGTNLDHHPGRRDPGGGAPAQGAGGGDGLHPHRAGRGHHPAAEPLRPAAGQADREGQARPHRGPGGPRGPRLRRRTSRGSPCARASPPPAGGSAQPIQLQIFGSDLATLNRLAHGVDGEAERAGDAGGRHQQWRRRGPGVRHPDRPPAGGRPGADRRPGGADGAHGLRRLGRHPAPAGQRGGHLHRDRRAGAADRGDPGGASTS